MNRTKWNKILRIRSHHTIVYETPLKTDDIKFADVNVGTEPNNPNAPKPLTWKDSDMQPNYQQDSVSEPTQKLLTWPVPLKRKREDEGFKRNVKKRYDLKRKLQITYLPRKMIKIFKTITMTFQKEQIFYDFDNGHIYRQKSPETFEKVGNKDKDGYLTFRLNGKNVRVHRHLYEMYHKVDLGKLVINHKNHQCDDNRIENLEAVTSTQNNQWQRTRKNNTSGHKGVSWNEKAKKWKAQIRINGKSTYIGVYDDINEAANAYKENQRELNLQGHKYYIED